MEKANNLWLHVKESLEKNLDKDTFDNTFKNINEVYKVNNNYIYLPVDGVLNKYRIEKFYLEKMNQILQNLVEEKTEFKIITAEAIKKEQEKNGN